MTISTTAFQRSNPEPEGHAAMPPPQCLTTAAEHAADWLTALPHRPVGASVSAQAMHDTVDDLLPELPTDADTVIQQLVSVAEPGLTAMGSPRFFGLVCGGTLPVAVAADWLTAAWDQNALLAHPAPATAALEDITGRWLLDLLDLPATASFAVVTGATLAHVTALAAARHRLLTQAGWDVERDGVMGAPRITVLTGDQRHVTIDKALGLLGLGRGSIRPVAVDDTGAMRADALAQVLAETTGPTLVCGQVGNVQGGAVDPVDDIVELAHRHGAWVHLDGAFGLWTRASADPHRRARVRGCERADSWTVNPHMTLNTPYDCGIAIIADPAAHRGAMGVTAPFFPRSGNVREPLDWTPESSRRARALPVYAALRSLGRQGVAELVDRMHDCAQHFATRLHEAPGFRVLAHNLTQVLVRAGDSDAITQRLIDEVQRDGTCWVSGGQWQGQHCIRISVCSWRTTVADVDASIEAMQRLLTELIATGDSAPEL